MALTEEQKARLRANLDRPFSPQRPSIQVGQPEIADSGMPSQLPPQIRAMISNIPEGRPYIKSLGATPQIAYPMPREEMERQITADYAKAQAKASIPKASDTMKRDFSRIDSFEGIMKDMETISRNVRKGPVKGRYISAVSNLTGGSEFGKKGILNEFIPDVSRVESENALNYEELRPGIAVGLYRAVTGDDRISDADAEKRALPFVPSLKLSTEAFQKRLKIIKRAIKRKRSSIRESMKMGTSYTGLGEEEDSLPMFLDVMSNSLSDEADD